MPILGLDPAGTLYRNRGTVWNGINRFSAKFVDIIHTDGGGNNIKFRLTEKVTVLRKLLLKSVFDY